MNQNPSDTRRQGLTRRQWLATAGAGLSIASPLAGFAQSDYPSKTIRLVVGYPPGGSVDMAARVLADVLTARLPATVVVVAPATVVVVAPATVVVVGGVPTAHLKSVALTHSVTLIVVCQKRSVCAGCPSAGAFVHEKPTL